MVKGVEAKVRGPRKLSGLLKARTLRKPASEGNRNTRRRDHKRHTYLFPAVSHHFESRAVGTPGNARPASA